MLIAVARGLSPGLLQADCAAAAYRAALSSAITPARRWGALLGLQGILAAQGKIAEASALLDSEASLALGGNALHLVLAVAGYADSARAAEVARRYGIRYETLPTANLWALGLWHAGERDVGRLEEIVDVVAGRAARQGSATPVWHARPGAG